MPRSPKDPGQPWTRCTALASALAVHALLAWLLLTPPRPSRPDAAPGMAVRWLPRWLPPPAPVPLPVASSTPAATAPPAVAAAPATPQARTPVPASAWIDSAPLDLRVAAGAGAGDGLDARTFTAPIIGQRAVHPAFAAPPRRFRMKRGMTPEQIVQGIAQALQLWPPGYIVDACRLSTSQVDYFQNAVDERDRDLLREALVSQRQDC